MEQYNFTYNDIHNTIRTSAEKIKASGFEPDYLLAIGGGGLIPARIMRTYINKPILIVSLSRYSDETGTAPSETPVKLQWLETDTNLDGKKVLVIDEVDDERTTLQFTLNHLYDTHPETEFAAFVVHNKLKEKKGTLPERLSHFFTGEDIHDYWINYAWDAENIDQFGKK
ncbi:phosphoribosyltransferase [Endozoicomonas sp. 8E]|uniref:phosphoribosyltransferase n=1 Tax=Endozoicomonas sp. 8E TaxID=3035692 RepID=UPI0029394EC1|nr:phosphoribosyltransferase [Endozoicomonas sp. 8E]WOG25722.1 phosphoribosyltransferase [Endozoicomonas sp. 8E]